MATRFQRRAVPDSERVGDLLSDSNSELSSVDEAEEEPAGPRRTGPRAEARATPRPHGAAAEVVSASENDDEEEEEDDGDGDGDGDDGGRDNNAGHADHGDAAAATTVRQRPPPVHAIKRKNSKWYDSDNDDDDWEHMASDGDRAAAKTADRARSRSVPVAAQAESRPRERSRADTAVGTSAETNQPPPPPAVLSPEGSATSKPPPEKRSSFQRLVGKTFSLSPFGSKRKALDKVASPASSGPDTPRGGGGSDSDQQRAHARDASAARLVGDALSRLRSPLSDVSSAGGDNTSMRSTPASDRRLAAAASGRGGASLSRKKNHERSAVRSDQTNGSDVVSPQAGGGFRQSPSTAVDTGGSRRRSNMAQSPGPDDTPLWRGSELPVGPTAGLATTAAASEALSPGQRKLPGAFPGRPDSGVLLEGWLRQKQRRGMKGLKKWNSRYFVLYAKTLEVRYYADVVQSAWGPIPLGEIGCISLRLIQRIGKPGTLKYKGCRLDITCRNTWGTHYADEYVSSDDENSNNHNNSDNDGDVAGAAASGGRAAAAPRSADKNTPKSSRVYSLMADSPQTAGAWFSMLDSLLVRSANSPRVDAGSAAAGTGSAGGKPLKRMGSIAQGAGGGGASGTPPGARMMTRRRTATTALDSDAVVLCGPHDHVPKPVLYAINFIFDSSPGIETEKFYETEPDAGRLKGALKFLNQFATDGMRKPAKEELEQALDAVTAGAVVKLWLAQLAQPLVPFELFDDFRALAAEAKAAPFELARNLRALVRALPPRNLAMLACVLFHLNDVHVYASKNGMDAAALAALFGEFILRARPSSSNQAAAGDRALLRVVVEEMIAHVDAIIDEKEAEILERV